MKKVFNIRKYEAKLKFMTDTEICKEWDKVVKDIKKACGVASQTKEEVGS